MLLKLMVKFSYPRGGKDSDPVKNVTRVPSVIICSVIKKLNNLLIGKALNYHLDWVDSHHL